jgi:serine/threonine protein phosphatase PrpC
VLMCSDGLTEMVSPLEIGGLVAGCGGDVVESARRLIDLANEAGGRDNTSVILVRVAVPGQDPEARALADAGTSLQVAEVGVASTGTTTEVLAESPAGETRKA